MQEIKDTNELKGCTAEVLAKEAVKILIEKKGLDVRLYNVSGVNSITDFYINVTGRSLTHVSSLCDDLVELLGVRGRDALRVEGKRGISWILVDYGDVIVNIFDKSAREFYDFDRHLPEGSLVDIEDCVRAVDDKMKVTED